MQRTDPVPAANTWGGTTCFHPLDERLRNQHGFRIACRPKRGPDLWRHPASPGELYTVREACALAGIRFDNE